MAGVDPKPDMPDIVYHYCGVDAFYGIVTRKEIWMSSVLFMNDYSEQTWFLKKASGRLNDFPQGEDRCYIDNLIENFDKLGQTPYACCFSANGDVLSQWRAYADDGAGFALGFSSRRLEEQKDKYRPTDAIAIWNVQYEDDQQLKYLDQFINDFLASVHRVNQDSAHCDRTSEAWRGKIREAGILALGRIWALSAVCKNRGFREEEEWRLFTTVLHDPADAHTHPPGFGTGLRMCFRASKRGIIPYFVLPFPEEAIAQVRLGPDNCARTRGAALKAFLNANGYDVGRIKISLSETTYGHAFH